MQVQRNKEMGKVFATVTIINRADQILAEAGVIQEEQIRSITFEKVLVDTGATTLCLPPDAIASLGLRILREVDVATATGISKARIFQDAKILMFEREGVFDCLELPGGADPLLGVIPLEFLGLEIDLKNQTLKPFPINSTETYLTIL